MPSSKVSPLLNLFSSLDWIRLSNPRLTDSDYYSLQYGLLNRAAIIENIIVNVCNRFLRLKSVNTNRTLLYLTPPLLPTVNLGQLRSLQCN
jgi:hypothetical protein